MKATALPRFAWSLCLVLPVLFSFAEVSAAGRWKSYVDPSLVSDIVHRDGKLYMATTGGLVTYDIARESFEQYTNTMGLPSNFLTSLAFDGSGALWVGTERAGMARLDERAGGFDVTPLTSIFHGLSDDQITDLAVWGDTLVYATKQGAGYIDIKTFKGRPYFEEDGLPGNLVRAVLPDGDRVWMATARGVVYLDRLGFIRAHTDTLFAAYSLERTDSGLWVGTETGVAYLKDGETSWAHTQLEDPPWPVFSLASDGEGLWAGSRRRFFRNDGSGWTGTDVRSWFDSYNLNYTRCEIRGLESMPGGTAYLGAGDPTVQRRGVHLLYFDGAEVREISFNAIPANSLLRLDFDVDESLWITTKGFGVAKLTPSGQWFNYNFVQGKSDLSWGENLTLLVDSQGSKWFARSRYPLQTPLTPLDELRDQLDTNYANDEWFHYQVGEGGGDGLGSLRNLGAEEDPELNRWFLSDEDVKYAPGWWGINILNREGSEWLQVNPTSTDPSGQLEGMKGGSVFDVAFSEDGVVYLGLKSYGVQRWSAGGYDQANLFDLTDDTWEMIATPGEGGFKSTANTLSLALRSDGVLWIGTDSGLYRYEHRYPTPDLVYIPALGGKLLGNKVSDLVLDRDENLWVATNLGLSRIARDNINDITSFTTPIVYQTQLNWDEWERSPVSPIVDADCERLALHPTRDILYIATANGLSELDIPSLEEKASGVSNVYLYPNPIRTGRGDESLKIANINSEVLVEIFTIEGELVHSDRVSRSGSAVWDLTTRSGFFAASGVYIVRIRGGGDTVIKKVSLVR